MLLIRTQSLEYFQQMKKIAKFLSYLWPVIAISYIIGFSFWFADWMEDIERTNSKWESVLAMPAFFLGVVILFIVHHFYGNIVKWFNK